MEIVEKIIDEIIDIIYNSPNRSEAVLPTETALCDKYGTKRSTVREALKVLQYFNIIKSSRGQGYSVALDSATTFALTAQKILNLYHFSYEEVSMLRQALEIQTASVIQQRGITEADVEVLRQCVTEMRNGKKVAIEADIKFHKHLASLSDNQLIIAITEAISVYTRRNIQAFWNSDMPHHETSAKEMVDAHEMIIEELLNSKITEISRNSVVTHYEKSNMFIPHANRFSERKGSPEQTQVRKQIQEWLELGWSPEEITAFVSDEKNTLEKLKNAPMPNTDY